MFVGKSWPALVKAVACFLPVAGIFQVCVPASAVSRIPQQPLQLQAPAIAPAGTAISLIATGGSGSGSLGFFDASLSRDCRIKGNSLISRVPATCQVYALKSADSQFRLARSNTITVDFRKPQTRLTLQLPASVQIGSQVSAIVSGGSGSGALSLRLVAANSLCTIEGLTVTATASTNCSVVAVKDADDEYAQTESKPVEIDTRPPYIGIDGPPWLGGMLGASAPYPGLRLLGLPARGWGGDVAPESFEYQWFRGEQEIAGATTKLYDVTTADCGFPLSFRVTARNQRFAPWVAMSVPTLPVQRFITAATPTIVGTRQPGRTVVASPGSWTAGSTFTYQWYRNGALIPGATARSYRMTAADQSKAIQVMVTGSKPGFRTASRLSDSPWKPATEALY